MPLSEDVPLSGLSPHRIWDTFGIAGWAEKREIIWIVSSWCHLKWLTLSSLKGITVSGTVTLVLKKDCENSLALVCVRSRKLLRMSAFFKPFCPSPLWCNSVRYSLLNLLPKWCICCRPNWETWVRKMLTVNPFNITHISQSTTFIPIVICTLGVHLQWFAVAMAEYNVHWEEFAQDWMDDDPEDD